jgi:hypothetical protein
MVLEQDVTLILTTCNLIEDRRVKCEQFWPTQA